MLIIAGAALLPALILLFYVYRKDLHPEPTGQVLKAFFYGGIAALASTLISGPLFRLGFYVHNPASFGECLGTAFWGAAVPEELAKLLMLWLLLRHNPAFDERFDGIVYGASVGLGFAAFENLLYVFGSGADWLGVSVSRALFAVPGHFAFGVVMGWYYSKLRFGDNGSVATKMILYPILLHGAYDTLCFMLNLNELGSGMLSLCFLIFCFWLFKRTRKRIQRASEEEDEWGRYTY